MFPPSSHLLAELSKIKALSRRATRSRKKEPMMHLTSLLLLAAVPSMAQVLHIQDLNTRQIRELDHARTAIILPGGILEEHGPYLPAFTDGYLSQRMAAELARA